MAGGTPANPATLVGDYLGLGFRLLSAMCSASFFRPGFTAITFGGLAFLSRALLRALSRGDIRSRSSLTARIMVERPQYH
jgi:hypothetical protein